MYKNLFFDFDGTLFDTYPKMLTGLQKMFKEKRNIEIPYDVLFKDAMVNFRYLGNKYELKEEEWDYYNKLLQEDSSLPPFKPFDGVEEMLKEFNQKGINCFIYTNRDERTIEYIKEYKLDKYFKDYILKAEKPDPTPLNNVIEKYNLNKKECLVVGDRELDLDSALNANVDSFSYNDYKAEAKATYQGQTFDDLKKVVFRLPIKAVLFDLDGVLVSTDEIHFKAWSRIAEDEGIYFDRIINNELRGISRVASLEVILRRASREYTPEEKAILLDRKGEYYREILDTLDENFIPNETKECLKQLKENGIKVAVASSSLNGGAILRKIGLDKEFDVIIDGTMITNAKPDPEVFLKAMDGYGLTPQECVIIEDATAGIDAGNTAGFISIGMSFVTEYNKTNIKINSLLELNDVINKLNSIIE